MTGHGRDEMKTTALILIAALSLLPACGTARGTGAGVGTAMGAAIGASVDDGNRWRGAAIGGAIGALAGFLVGDEADRQEDFARGPVYDRRPVVREYCDPYGDPYRVETQPEGETRVTTRVTRFDPQTGEWYVVSEEVQDLPR